MTDRHFDPLNDRLSRDIRNELSEAFAQALAARNLAPIDAVATRYRASGLLPVYEAYLADRLVRYQEALRITQADQLENPFSVALVLWDHELFFEVHEILEQAWHMAHGAEKEILQAMIRAAGMYIKFAMGQPEAARKMATKAVAALEQHRTLVETKLPLARLLDALTAFDPQPPRLYEPKRS